MTYAGWVAIWNSIVAEVAQAPFALQLLIWLGLAFAVTMSLEGARVSLLPRRWLARRMARSPFVVPPQMEKPVKLASPAPMAPLSSGFEIREKPAKPSGKLVPPAPRPRRNRKKVISALRRTRPIRPKITRYPADPPESLLSPIEFVSEDVGSTPMQESAAQM